MKLFYNILFLLLILNSCIFNTDFYSDMVEVKLSISDTTGVVKYKFKTHEEFLISFSVMNNSGKDLNYYSGLPVISYSVVNGDSVIVRSTDFMCYEAVMINGKIKNNDLFKDTWIGSNSLGRKQSGQVVRLEPGRYQLHVHHGSFFSEYKLPRTDFIDIEIVELNL